MQSSATESASVAAETGPNTLLMSSVRGKTFKEDDLFISIMGLTGSGKSTFISLLTEEKPQIGHDLLSCTKFTSIYTTSCFGRTVHLIDTPGFDDTSRPDYQVLIELTTWLNLSYKMNVRLSGAIYLHRITDVKMGGAASLNLRTFYQLVGDENMESVLLVTTHWDKVGSNPEELQRCYDRENQLKNTPEFWATLIESKAIAQRHMNTQKTAMEILHQIIAKETKTTLKVQKEMNVEGMKLIETSCGRVVNEELLAQQEIFKKEILQIKEEQTKVAQKRDDRYKAELARERDHFEARLRENAQMQEQFKKSAMEQVEEKLGQIKKLTDDINTIKQQQKDDQSETQVLRGELWIAQDLIRDQREALIRAQSSSSDTISVAAGPFGMTGPPSAVAISGLAFLAVTGICSIM